MIGYNRAVWYMLMLSCSDFYCSFVVAFCLISYLKEPSDVMGRKERVLHRRHSHAGNIPTRKTVSIGSFIKLEASPLDELEQISSTQRPLHPVWVMEGQTGTRQRLKCCYVWAGAARKLASMSYAGDNPEAFEASEATEISAHRLMWRVSMRC